MKKIDLIALDLDGTALNPQNQVSPATADAVRRARESGIHVVVSTGRICGEARDFALMLGTDDQMVTSGGATLSSVSQERCTMRMSMPWEAAVRASAVVERIGMITMVYVGETLLITPYDDIEFGIRNQKAGIVFLNGFGVWHKGFELTFTGVNTYYDVRNTLITTALIEKERSQTEILKWIWKRITVDIIEFRYGEMRLAYQAFYDFCRGPEWLSKTDAEKLNNWLREQVAMKPIENLKEELGEEDYRRIKQYAEDYRDSYEVKTVNEYFGPARKAANLVKKATFNGWLLPADKKIIALSPVESPFQAFRKKKVVLFEPFSGKAVLAKKDWKQMWLACGLYRDAWRLMKKHKSAAEKYRNEIQKFTCMDAWKQYLEIEKGTKK